MKLRAASQRAGSPWPMPANVGSSEYILYEPKRSHSRTISSAVAVGSKGSKTVCVVVMRVLLVGRRSCVCSQPCDGALEAGDGLGNDLRHRLDRVDAPDDLPRERDRGL